MKSSARTSRRTPRTSRTGKPGWGGTALGSCRWLSATGGRHGVVPGEGSHPQAAPNAPKTPHLSTAEHLIPGCRLSSARSCRRFLHEYASSYSEAPLPVLLGSTRTFLSMVSTCCISPAPTTCFLKEVSPFRPPGSSAPCRWPEEKWLGKAGVSLGKMGKTPPLSFCGRNWKGKPSLSLP